MLTAGERPGPVRVPAPAGALSDSDRQRIREALARWDSRCGHLPEGPQDPAIVLALAVDWLRAEVKLIDRYLDAAHTGWGQQALAEAAQTLYRLAAALAARIREESSRALPSHAQARGRAPPR